MLSAFIEASQALLQWSNLLLVVTGTLLGMFAGAVPGLNSPIVIALILPLTYGMNTLEAMMLLVPIAGGANFGGSLTAILINVPGTATNVATTLDGYPMACQGRAAEAIGASATASALGALFGLLILILLIPFIRRIVMLFGPPEFFLLAVFAILSLAFLMRGTMIDGLIAGGTGLILSFVGFNPVLGGTRYSFGTMYLWDGIQLIPFFLGLYAVAESLDLASSPGRISAVPLRVSGSTWKGIVATFYHWKLFLRSAALGTVIGAIPALGGTVAAIASYVQAKQTKEKPEAFGHGDVRGVIAPEAANDAKDGGALMPTLAFGIPGSEVYVILLGAFLLHGVLPGKEMFTDHLDVVWAVILALIVSNVLTSVIGILIGARLARLTVVPTIYLAPTIFMTSLLGSYAVRSEILDGLTAVIFGLFGLLMKRYGLPRIVAVVAFVLGPIAERSFFQSLQISGGSYAIFLLRPVSLILVLLIALSIVFASRAVLRRT